MNNTTGAPSDIRIDGNTSDSFFESAASGTTIGVLSATPSGGQTISTFQILGISNGTNQNGRFTAVLDSGTWYLKTNDTFLFKNNSDALQQRLAPSKPPSLRLVAARFRNTMGLRLSK